PDSLTACITNDPSAPITHVSDHVLLCHAGPEKSVAATKTYTTALAVVALLVAVLADRRDMLDELNDAPKRMKDVLSVEESAKVAVQRFRDMEEWVVLARGINQATALEAALKITEASYVVATA